MSWFAVCWGCVGSLMIVSAIMKLAIHERAQ